MSSLISRHRSRCVLAAEHQRLGGRVDAGRLEAPGVPDAAPDVGGERLRTVDTEPWLDAQPPGELLGRQPSRHGRVTDQPLRPVGVERLHQLGQRGGHRQARNVRPGGLQVGEELSW
jgi:hypothetical protein